MWIKMSETYVGGLGLFAKDTKYDISQDVIEKLPKGSYRKCRAPWDEQTKKARKAKDTKAKGKKMDDKKQKSTKKATDKSPADKQARPEKPGGNYKTK